MRYQKVDCTYPRNKLDEFRKVKSKTDFHQKQKHIAILYLY